MLNKDSALNIAGRSHGSALRGAQWFCGVRPTHRGRGLRDWPSGQCKFKISRIRDEKARLVVCRFTLHWPGEIPGDLSSVLPLYPSRKKFCQFGGQDGKNVNNSDSTVIASRQEHLAFLLQKKFKFIAFVWAQSIWRGGGQHASMWFRIIHHDDNWRSFSAWIVTATHIHAASCAQSAFWYNLKMEGISFFVSGGMFWLLMEQ